MLLVETDVEPTLTAKVFQIQHINRDGAGTRAVGGIVQTGFPIPDGNHPARL